MQIRPALSVAQVLNMCPLQITVHCSQTRLCEVFTFSPSLLITLYTHFFSKIGVINELPCSAAAWITAETTLN